MKNVTISMKDEVLREVRLAAARAEKSVSRYIADLVEQDLTARPALGQSTRKSQLEALERILSGPKWNVMRDGRMPTADERNER